MMVVVGSTFVKAFHFALIFFFFHLSVSRRSFAIRVRMSAWPHLGILPPVFILQFCSAGLKLRGSSLQGIGPVVQFWQLLITFQNLVHIYTHDIHHLRKNTKRSVVKSAIKTGWLCVWVTRYERLLKVVYIFFISKIVWKLAEMTAAKPTPQ